MAMTCFQSTNLAVAGGNCGLSMWDLVEEKRVCYHESPSLTFRATAICQVNSAPLIIIYTSLSLFFFNRLMVRTPVWLHVLLLELQTAQFLSMMCVSVGDHLA
jgi:hypothetical protein